MSNATGDFLNDSRYLRRKATIQLDDVQALYGGQRLLLKGDGRLVFTQVAPGGKESVSTYYLPAADPELIWRLCEEQDLLTIRPEERPGIPDEVRQTITLTNFRGEQYGVSKWAGVTEARFTAIMDALLALARRAEQARSVVPPPPPRWPRYLFFGLVGVLLFLFPIWPARPWALALTAEAARPAVTGLLAPVLLGALLVPLLIGLFFFLELRQAGFRTLFPRDISLLPYIIGLFYLISLILLASFLWEVGFVRWGATVSGTIEDKWVVQSTDFTTDPPTPETLYRLAYGFRTAEGDEISRQADVSRRFYEATLPGASVTVYYVPWWPRLARLEAAVSARGRAANLLTIWLVMAGWLLEITFVAHLIWPRWRQAAGQPGR